MLLILASMIDNMPYVLAEASIMRIPLLVYDVGGVTEMIDPELHADVICGTPQVRELLVNRPLRMQRELPLTLTV
jgi:glycosyltransferase involved in cell wall biosynthesis